MRKYHEINADWSGPKMNEFDYFLLAPKSFRVPPQLRRFPKDSDTGERYSFYAKKWTPECCRRRACELTGDKQIDAAEVAGLCE